MPRRTKAQRDALLGKARVQAMEANWHRHEAAMKRSAQRLQDTLETKQAAQAALDVLEKAIVMQYIVKHTFATYSPAKQAKLTAQMEALDAALMELAEVFESAQHPDTHPPTPRTFEEALGDVQNAPLDDDD